MSFTAHDLPRLDGRTAVVTGANSGIGRHTAQALSEHGARVVLACRNRTKAEKVADAIRTPDGAPVDVAELDLSDLASVRAFADAWDGPLDLLVNNAGVMAPPKPEQTADGFERQFGTNHLGHFVLTGLLLQALASAPAARVVTVSSIAHRGGSRAVLDANAGEAYDPRRTYANSKLANLLFARQLHRELTERQSTVSSTAAHPGVSATGLVSSPSGMGASPVIRTVAPLVMRVATQGAAAGARPTLFAASAGEPGSYSGPGWLFETRGPVGPAHVSSLADDPELARRLWDVSEELTGLRYDWSALGPTDGSAGAPAP